MRSTTIAMVMTAATLTAPRITAAGIDPDARVVIRTYENTTLPGDSDSVRATANTILETAGLDLTWVACGVVLGRQEDDPCVAPLAANELALRFVRQPPSQVPTGQIALGDAFVDTRLRAGSLATLYVDRVAALAATCQLDVSILLGRAIAHEVGHLLLGTTSHAPAGLMRAAWSQDTLRDERAGDWVFAPRDAQAMREAVRVRTAGQVASGRWGD